ncbi:hypothetical protein P7K49_018805 [Saguinus oedipus]|uniref:Uncharacterized protein n=1 Tax=Saguinus oedipus TaxID=9490 RepID=A0ABQ9V7N0_SAGOE|nr:hypothetical protein P7K49_018805 [Saguinus oedipus]
MGPPLAGGQIRPLQRHSPTWLGGSHTHCPKLSSPVQGFRAHSPSQSPGMPRGPPFRSALRALCPGCVVSSMPPTVLLKADDLPSPGTTNPANQPAVALRCGGKWWHPCSCHTDATSVDDTQAHGSLNSAPSCPKQDPSSFYGRPFRDQDADLLPFTPRAVGLPEQVTHTGKCQGVASCLNAASPMQSLLNSG